MISLDLSFLGLSTIDINALAQASFDTLYMSFISCFFAVIFGLPLGAFLNITKKSGLMPMLKLNGIIGYIVNMLRSFPFIILIVIILPFSRLIVGSSIGVNAAIIPLSISAIPFIARLVEGVLDEVDKGLIEAAKSVGASRFIIIKMMLAEGLPSLINVVTITLINLIGYSAMAGSVGAGGLGDLAIRLGYQSFRIEILFACVLIIIIIVQLIQSLGEYLSGYLRRKRGL